MYFSNTLDQLNTLIILMGFSIKAELYFHVEFIKFNHWGWLKLCLGHDDND